MTLPEWPGWRGRRRYAGKCASCASIASLFDVNAEPTNRLRYLHGKFLTDMHRRTDLCEIHLWPALWRDVERNRTKREVLVDDGKSRTTTGAQIRTPNIPWNADTVEAFSLVTSLPSPCAALLALRTGGCSRDLARLTQVPSCGSSGTGKALSPRRALVRLDIGISGGV